MPHSITQYHIVYIFCFIKYKIYKSDFEIYHIFISVQRRRLLNTKRIFIQNKYINHCSLDLKWYHMANAPANTENE